MNGLHGVAKDYGRFDCFDDYFGYLRSLNIPTLIQAYRHYDMARDMLNSGHY